MQVRLDSAPETPKCYHNCELCVIRNGKGKRPEGYVEPPLSELAKLRREPEETAVVGEEERLSAALEAAFPSREEQPQHQAAEKEEMPRRRSRNRHRKPKSEGGSKAGPAPGSQPPQSQPKEQPKVSQDSGEQRGETERKPNRRRRRHRPRGGGKTTETKSE